MLCVLVTVLILLPRIVVTFNYRFVAINNPFNDQSFDRKVWMANAGNTGHDNPRGDMVTDLIRHHLRKGMTQDSVVRLLGEPDHGKSREVYRYNIGWGHTWKIDPYYLEIYFDEARHLVCIEMPEG